MRDRLSLSVLVFIGAIGLSVLATALTYVLDWQRARVVFEADARELHQQIEARLDELTALLRGGAGLHATLTIAPDDVFATYVSRLDLPRNYPGVMGIGFARYLSSGEIDDYDLQVRDEAFPDFETYPRTGRRGEAFVIRMLEPLDGPNRLAIGFDMSSESGRRAAMVNAAATGYPTVTGRVTLIQEVTADKQAGFLLYVPVYAKGDVPQTEAERWEQVLGLSYAPLRAADFFEPIQGPERPAFQVFTSSDLGPETFLYATRQMRPHDWEVRMVLSGPIGWNVRYLAAPVGFMWPVWLVGALGLMLSLALYMATAAAERRQRESMQLQEREAAVAQAVEWMGTAPAGSIPMTERLADWLVEEGPAVGVVVYQGEDRLFERGALTEERVEQETVGLRIVVSPEGPGEADWIARVLERASWLLERANLHEQVRDALVQSEESLRFANVLMGILGHDLRNPLSSIRTAGRLLQGSDPRPQSQAILQRIQASVDRMTRLIEQVLDFTRARIGGGIPIHRVPVDLKDLALDIVGELRTAVPGSQVELRFRGDTQAQVDPDRFAQALSNLLGNALEHGEERRAAVEIDGEDPARIRLSLWNPGTVPPDTLPRVFEPFLSGDPSRGGLGLGMYIARILVEGHDGQIAMASDGEGGTTVRVVMPRGGPEETGPVAP